MECKYIIFEDRGFEMPLVFSKFSSHNEMRPLAKVVSAGFVSFCAGENGEIEPHCYGKSVSLRLESRPQDSEIVKNGLTFVM